MLIVPPFIYKLILGNEALKKALEKEGYNFDLPPLDTYEGIDLVSADEWAALPPLLLL